MRRLETSQPERPSPRQKICQNPGVMSYRGQTAGCNARWSGCIEHREEGAGSGLRGWTRERHLEAIFRTHFADLYRCMYHRVHHAPVAEDVTFSRRCAGYRLPLSRVKEMLVQASIHRRLQRALDGLAERDRVILTLRYVQGESVPFFWKPKSRHSKLSRFWSRRRR